LLLLKFPVRGLKKAVDFVYGLYTIVYDLYTEVIMLDLLFSSRDRVKLLQVLLLGTEEDYYLRELAEVAGVAVRAAQREIPRLVKLGLLTKRRRGNRVYLSVNRDCPIYPELRMIFVKVYGAAAVIGSALKRAKDGIDLAFIYGSVANGDFGPESDIDLMVVGKV